MPLNPLEQLKAISLRRNKLGWIVVEFTIEDGKVIDTVETDPDIRAVAIEKLRRKFASLVVESAQ